MAKILIIGGSLGGLFAANILLKQGHDVLVLEKSVGSLDGRGAGIMTHISMVDVLKAAGVFVDLSKGVELSKRVILGHSGAVTGEMKLEQITTSWTALYHMLKESFPAERYLQGKHVVTVTQDDHRVQVVCDDESSYEAQLLLASDGIRSTIRKNVDPLIKPVYSGYIAWRGVCKESDLSEHTQQSLFNYFGFSFPEGEQILGYPVAGAENKTAVGHRRYNFVWYRPVVEDGDLAALMTDDEGKYYPTGIPPQKVASKHILKMHQVARDILPPQFVEVIEKTSGPFFQPIYDLCSEKIAFNRIALMGDAAFTARPHVGAGVSKAGDDALNIASKIQEFGPGPEALLAYQNDRLHIGKSLVDRGRYLGKYLQAQNPIGSPKKLVSKDQFSLMTETATDPSTYL